MEGPRPLNMSRASSVRRTGMLPISRRRTLSAETLRNANGSRGFSKPRNLCSSQPFAHSDGGCLEAPNGGGRHGDTPIHLHMLEEWLPS